MSLLVRFRGVAPRCDPSAYLAPHTSIIGDVEIGADSSIWFGTVIRGDDLPIRIGRATSIQDNSVLHVTSHVRGTTVGDRVTVGHRVILHACDVEDDCLIGMGAIILDRARIGRGSFVGAGALVTPGTDIPPGSHAPDLDPRRRGRGRGRVLLEPLERQDARAATLEDHPGPGGHACAASTPRR
jgi:carbonic anhydrase/acetyltransferase-like protein (isoleucine patch superfamily)